MKKSALAVAVLTFGIIAGFALAGGASDGPVSAADAPGNLVPFQIDDNPGDCFDTDEEPIFTSMCPIEGLLDLQAPDDFCSNSRGSGDIKNLIENGAPGVCNINQTEPPSCDPSRNGPWYDCVAVQRANPKMVFDGVAARLAKDGDCDSVNGNGDGVDDFLETVILVFGSGLTGIYAARDCDPETAGTQASPRFVTLIVLEDPPTLSGPAGYPILARAGFYLAGCAAESVVVIDELDLDRYCTPAGTGLPGKAVIYGRFVNIIYAGG